MVRLRTGAIMLTNRSLLIIIARNVFTNGTTLVHEIHMVHVVGKYIMERCDVDLSDICNTETRFI